MDATGDPASSRKKLHAHFEISNESVPESRTTTGQLISANEKPTSTTTFTDNDVLNELCDGAPPKDLHTSFSLKPVSGIRESTTSGRASVPTAPRTSRVSQSNRTYPAPPPPPQVPGNPATEISIERAVYYDTLNEAIGQGLDETRAIDLGVKARARAKEIHDKARQRIAEEHERIAREYMERERERERQEELQRKKLETEQLLQQQQQQQQINPQYAINSDLLTETIENATPRWPDDIHASHHPYTNQPNKVSLGTLLKKIVSPAVRKGIREGIPDLMIQSRMLHNRMNDLTKEQVAKEWEQRANHSELKIKITTLEAENSLLKQQSLQSTALNVKLQREVEELRRDYSNSQEEYKLLVAKNAKRRLQCASYRRKLKSLRELGHESSSNHRTYRSSESGGSRSVSPDRSDIEHMPDTSSSYRSYNSDDLENSNSDSEWEAWCQTTSFSKPGWNTSTASKLLSQKAPPSVIHIGESPMAGIEETVSLGARGTTNSAYSKSLMSDSEDESTAKKRASNELKAKFHAKCTREIQRLRELVEIERGKAKTYKMAAVPNEKKSRIMEIIDILQECLASQEKYRTTEMKTKSSNIFQIDHGALESVDSVNDERDEDRVLDPYKPFLDSLKSNESLLWSLLNAISAHDASKADHQQALLRSPSPTRSHMSRPQSACTQKKSRPSSASSRNTTASTTLGIKSIQVLLAEIDHNHHMINELEDESELRVSPSFVRPNSATKLNSGVYVQKTLKDIYSNSSTSRMAAAEEDKKGNEGAVKETAKKQRPKSAPMRFESVENAAEFPRIDAIQIGVPKISAKSPSVIHSSHKESEEMDQPTRWQLLSTHFKNPLYNAFPPREPIRPLSTKARSVVSNANRQKRQQGGLVGGVRWHPRPVDHTAGPHHGEWDGQSPW
ncbi:hypothetical protein BDR26DRAFT_954700 [Obelidium mucronatum]|nr:hypothetical protein BDR26DRAFT_954700 [Obelidium mucronatum]